MEANSAAHHQSEGDDDRNATASTSGEMNPRTNESPEPAVTKLNDKERYEAFQFLAKSATSRFLERRKYEWQLAIALWTALGVSAAYLLTQDKAVSTAIIWFVLGLSFLVVLVYAFVWIPWIAEANDRDQATSYYWESAIEDLTGPRLSKNLQPPKPWPCHPKDEQPDNQTPFERRKSRLALAYGQASHQSQVGTTLIFWLVFVCGVGRT